jgi:23S rRNA (adenine2503-C2)-methyltransferase
MNSLEQTLIGEPAFRRSQVKKALFVDLINDWDEATNLPQSLRQHLNKQFPLTIDAKEESSANQKTTKALIHLPDGKNIETVLMRHQAGHNTVCVSSQVGCPVGCAFCATGQLGFKRNLNTWEIVQQVLYFARKLKKQGQQVTNVVFMGMGEPFLNYDNVMEAAKTLNDPDGLAIGARKISISTVGIIPGILEFADEKYQFNLALSLHAPTQKLRERLIPVAKQYQLQDILKALTKYLNKSNRKVMIEYILLKDMNDSEAQAHELTTLLKDLPQHLYMINLIQYNATDTFQPSSQKQVNIFKHILVESGIEVTQRYKFGRDVHGACGQLAGTIPKD